MKKMIGILFVSVKQISRNIDKFHGSPKSFGLFISVICLIMSNNSAFSQISRAQIINNAAPYTSFTWTASSCNLWSGTTCSGKKVYSADVPWVNVGTNVSMPYCWGGWSTQEQHIAAMANCKSAGDICSANGGGCSGGGAGLSCASGHDCSGLVSRAWGLTSKQSTSTLPGLSTAIPLSQVQPGDIVNIAGSHVRLVETNYGNGNYCVIEASGKDWKTAYHTYTALQLASYSPRCPNSGIVTGGCGAPPPSNDDCSNAVTLTPNTSCITTTGNTAGATQSVVPISCGGYTSTLCNDVWFQFTATSTTHVITVYPSSGLDAVADLRSGSCSGTTLSCSDNGGGEGRSETIAATGLNVGSTYYIRIYDYTGNSTPPATTTFDICVTGGCGLPGPVTVSGSGIFCTNATLTAAGGSGGTIYWQGITNNGTSTETPSAGQTVTSSGTYYFRAYNSCGWGDQGSATVTINTTPTTQAANLTFSGVGTGSMTATWVNGNGSRRVVYVNTADSFSAPPNGTDLVGNPVYGGSGQQGVYNGTGNSVTVTGLSAGTNYWFRVYEANCTGSSSIYNTVTGTNNPGSQTTTSSCFPPSSPTSATASLTTINSGQSTDLQVNGGALNSAPDWIWYTGSCGSTQVGTGASLTVTPTITTTYYVQATACGTSTTCRPVIIKVIPAAPVALAASAVTQTSFSANWSASPGATGYYLDVSTSGSFSSFLKNNNNKKINNATTFSVSGLTAGTPYYYRVRAYNAAGTSPNSNSMNQTTSSKTAFAAADAASDLNKTGLSAGSNASATAPGNNYNDIGASIFEVSMYPNPTRGEVVFDIDQNIKNLVVTVFNSFGTEVFCKEYLAPERISIDLSMNSSGLYIVRLNSGSMEIVKKLVLDK
jgi:hypothetical protein